MRRSAKLLKVGHHGAKEVSNQVMIQEEFTGQRNIGAKHTIRKEIEGSNYTLNHRGLNCPSQKNVDEFCKSKMENVSGVEFKIGEN